MCYIILFLMHFFVRSVILLFKALNQNKASFTHLFLNDLLLSFKCLSTKNFDRLGILKSNSLLTSAMILFNYSIDLLMTLFDLTYFIVLLMVASLVCKYT